MPLSFDALDGATTFSIGEDIVDMAKTKTALILIARTRVDFLTGQDSSNFSLDPISEESGGQPNTFQIMGEPLFLDDIGLRQMSAVQAFGSWIIGTLTILVEPYIRAKRELNVLPSASVRVRSKDQYRLFYDNKSGFFAYFGRKQMEVLFFELGFQVNTVESVRDTTGSEIILAGDLDTGFVFQLDAGNSFDGGEVEAFIQFSFVNQGLPRHDKRYHRLAIDIEAFGQMTIAITADYGFGNPDLTSGPEDVNVTGTGGIWDVANWDQFQWSVPISNQLIADLEGIGANVSFSVLSDHTYEFPHTISTATIFYTKRRLLR